jgi:hypothetical protein
MLEIVDYSQAPKVLGALYGGAAGRKIGVVQERDVWMLKYPQSTRDNPNVARSYTTSPLSEYIASHIYASLGIPVHETRLGVRDGKLIVACKDFATEAKLIEFSKIKNSVADELVTSNSSNSHGDLMADVLTTIELADEFATMRDAVRARFWDMFVVDALVVNGDRNNGNWGVLQTGDAFELAPVYDNGGSFFSKRNNDVFAARLANEEYVKQDAIGTNTSYYLRPDGHHYHPTKEILAGETDGINQAILRLVPRIDLPAITAMIEEIPQEYAGIEVMPAVVKRAYLTILTKVYEDVLLPAYERLLIRN